MMGAVRAGARLLALVSALLVAPTVRADDASTAQRATAESLFADGKRLMAEGNLAQACNAFAESQRLDAGGGTIFALAFCHEQQRRTASAWLEFKEALAVARRDGRRDREVLALEHIAALEPRLSRVTVRVASPSPSLSVRLDGAAVAAAAWGTSIPLDPGPHTIDASAPGKRPWSIAITVHGDSESYVTDVPALADAPIVAPRPADAPAPRRVEARQGQRVVGLVTSGVGVALIGAGAAFGMRAVIAKNRSDASCDRATCDAAGLAEYDTARSSARVANIALGAGVVAIGIGLALVVTARRTADAPASALHVVPAIGASGGGLELRARF